MKIISGLASTLVLVVFATACIADEASSDEADLMVLLGWFLVEVDKAETHDAFWADDLVYTSSAGTRFGKAEIMSGFNESEEPGGPVTRYVAEDVDIRVYGKTAVVAFRLRATQSDNSAVQFYLNTGTFLKRNDTWQAVAWQATKMSPAE
tara:strand:- start:64645 stop:65094 length:450 start_codon:yes stop_codon:yes gene_type:complete